jgi:hypothetical protein
MGKNTKGIDIIKEIIAKYKIAGHPIEILGADEGEVNQADHRIITTESISTVRAVQPRQWRSVRGVWRKHGQEQDALSFQGSVSKSGYPKTELV